MPVTVTYLGIQRRIIMALLHTRADWLTRSQNLGRERFLKEHPHPFLVSASSVAKEIPGSRPLKTTQLEASMVARVLASIQTGESETILAVIKRESGRFEGLVSVGRAPSTDLSLDLDGISRFHAYFTSDLYERDIYLRDGNSTNGTFINGKPLGREEKVALTNGDQVSFSPDHAYRFYSSEGFLAFLGSG